MHQVCAWCGKEMGVSSTDGESHRTITHGICASCAYHLIAQAGMPLQEYLDGLDTPVLVVNGDGIVETANAQARAILQKDLSQIVGQAGGDVFECEYARLPEGCGNTIHCAGCAIRRTVMHTHETGQSHTRVPAVLNWEGTDEKRQIPFLISTEKVQNIVLLRVDRVGE